MSGGHRDCYYLTEPLSGGQEGLLLPREIRRCSQCFRPWSDIGPSGLAASPFQASQSVTLEIGWHCAETIQKCCTVETYCRSTYSTHSGSLTLTTTWEYSGLIHFTNSILNSMPHLFLSTGVVEVCDSMSFTTLHCTI